MIGSLGLKKAIVSLLVIAPLTSLNALSSVGLQWNLVSVLVKSISGFVSDAYQGMNLGRKPVIPRKLLTSVFDRGGGGGHIHK